MRPGCPKELDVEFCLPWTPNLTFSYFLASTVLSCETFCMHHFTASREQELVSAGIRFNAKVSSLQGAQACDLWLCPLFLVATG